jgi:cation diffusion facilitator CzcD-associated flavoprotein CzcO
MNEDGMDLQRDQDVPSAPSPEPDIDVLVVGAGITGIYQLYCVLREGFTARLIEAGDGVGGTWFWNRYPGARFDSDSYTYGYLFSQELFDEWEWQEHFAEQPETERYLNHVVDRFDLRRHMRFGAKVTSAVWGEPSGTWTVTTDDGTTTEARFLIPATGVLSVPYLPDIPGRDRFQGEQHHTGRWPAEPVELAGKRVAVVGTSSSGVQVVPAIIDEVASITVYQRSANWCTPLNNRPITGEEQARLRADFEELREILNTSIHGFHHPPNTRSAFEDSAEDRRAFFEEMWETLGFMKVSSNYADLLTDPEVNAEWCEFIAGKIRATVHDPDLAERLIPRDHGYGEKRPPFVTGYFEAFNRSNIELVDLRETPMVQVTESGIETTDGVREFDLIVWATGFDFGTGAMLRMGIRGRDGLALEDHWAEGPTTFLGVQSRGFPNLFSPGGPHSAAANVPRYNCDQVDFITATLVYSREHGYDVIEPTAEAEEEWTTVMDAAGSVTPFGRIGQYVGGNIPGKPTRYLLNAAGRPYLFETIANVVSSDYATFQMSRAPSEPR